MKRFLSLIILLSAVTIALHAQNLLRLGVKGGFDIQDMRFDEEVFKTQNKLGWFVGPTIQVSLPVAGLGLDIAGLYDQKSTKVNGNSIKQEYLLVPVNARLTLGVGEAAGLYVAAGPQFAFNIGDENEFEWTHEYIQNTFQLKKSALSVNLGAGFFLSSHLEFGFNYNVSVTSTAEASWDAAFDAIKDDTKPKSWQISATYYF